MSRSPLESQDFFAKFFFFFSKLENILRFLFLISIFWQKFSFSSLTRKQISTFLFSLLEIRDMDSIFLFLFSISLSGISSMHDLILYSLHLHEYVRLRSLNLGPNCSIGLAEQGPIRKKHRSQRSDNAFVKLAL